MEENNSPKIDNGMIVVKIIFGFTTCKGQYKRGFKFSKENTIKEAINMIILKEKMGDIDGDIGLFKSSIGWLDPKLTLSSYDIKYEVK
jgi:hypothetical protein